MKRKIFSLLVENTSGAGSHVVGLFSRRGYNIESFSSGSTNDPEISRVTIVSSGDDNVLEQIEKQLEKLEDVMSIRELEEGKSVCRELMLVKIRVQDHQRQAVFALAKIFRASIVDVSDDSLIIELSGEQSKLEAFLELVSEYEVLELARTGLTGLTRGI